MDQDAKIHLSSFERSLLNDANWILTKNGVLKKVQLILEAVQQGSLEYTIQHPALFPEEVRRVPPKISRGENYQGLPWLMLDCPRYFDKENIFAIRTMFWWGNFFSSTFQLRGRYKQDHEQVIVRNYNKLVEQGFNICIKEDPWQHHFEKDNYLPVKDFSELEFSRLLRQSSFTKLSCRLSLSEWDNAPVELLENFRRIVALLY